MPAPAWLVPTLMGLTAGVTVLSYINQYQQAKNQRELQDSVTRYNIEEQKKKQINDAMLVASERRARATGVSFSGTLETLFRQDNDQLEENLEQIEESRAFAMTISQQNAYAGKSAAIYGAGSSLLNLGLYASDYSRKKSLARNGLYGSQAGAKQT